MAHRVLNSLPAIAGTLAGCVLAGCPHDWEAFESVPRELPRPDAAATDAPGSSPDAGDATFAALGEKPILIAADDDGIVFATASGSVLSCPHTGCKSPASIADAQKDIRALAIGHGFVAWTSRGDNTVRRATRVPGAGPTEQAFDDDGLEAVALSPKKVFFSVDAIGLILGAPGIRSCTPGDDCGDITFGSFAEGVVTELLFSGTDAFWLGEDRLSGCPIAACDGDVGKRAVLAQEPVAAHALTADADTVYYGSPLEGGTIRAVPRASMGGAPATPRAVAIGIGSLTRIVATTRSVWFTSAAAGTVARAPRDGGTATSVAAGLAGPSGIASGGGYVYVACSGDGRIMRWERD